MSTSTPANIGTSTEYLKKSEELADKYTKHVDDAVNRWGKCDEVYFGKERDLQNFPAVKYPVIHPKVRMGFLPDSWFQALYPKTGVTGPYLFLFGSTAFLINKEIWVVDAHFIELGVFVSVMTFLIKRYGAMAAKFFDKDVEQLEQTKYYQPMKSLHDHLARTIETSDSEMTKASAISALVKAKEENVGLQLEATYRDRLQQVNRAVKRRLDYHVEREDTRRQFQQHHMVEWVVNNVVKGITPTQEKETLTNCISELKRLGQIYKSSAAAV